MRRKNDDGAGGAAAGRLDALKITSSIRAKLLRAISATTLASARLSSGESSSKPMRNGGFGDDEWM